MAASDVAARVADWLFRGETPEALGPYFAPLISDASVDLTVQGFDREAGDFAATSGNLIVSGGILTNASEIVFGDMTGEAIHFISVGEYDAVFSSTIEFELTTPITPDPAGLLVIPAGYLSLTLSSASGAALSTYARDEALKLLADTSALVEDYDGGFLRHLALLDASSVEFSGGGYTRALVGEEGSFSFRQHGSPTPATTVLDAVSVRFTDLSEMGLDADTLAHVRVYDDNNNALISIEVPVDVTVNQDDKLWFEGSPSSAITIESTVT